jgi:hypothetical protein
VKVQAIEQEADAPEALRGILDGNPTNQAMHFVPLAQQKLGQVAAVLPRDAGNQC